MKRTYKNATIAKNMNGDWIVKLHDGAMSQHSTLAAAKDHIDFMSISA